MACGWLRFAGEELLAQRKRARQNQSKQDRDENAACIGVRFAALGARPRPLGDVVSTDPATLHSVRVALELLSEKVAHDFRVFERVTRARAIPVLLEAASLAPVSAGGYWNPA
jgi:hypothetical protein